MNLFENLQMMKESVNELVKTEREKYGITDCSYGTNYTSLDLEPTDEAAKEFINKIEADGYLLMDEQKDGIENHISENDVTLVYGKEVEGDRCVIAISIHPSENYVIVSCGYDEEEHDNEFFENLQTMKESNDDVITVKITGQAHSSEITPEESEEYNEWVKDDYNLDIIESGDVNDEEGYIIIKGEREKVQDYLDEVAGYGFEDEEVEIIE